MKKSTKNIFQNLEMLPLISFLLISGSCRKCSLVKCPNEKLCIAVLNALTILMICTFYSLKMKYFLFNYV